MPKLQPICDLDLDLDVDIRQGLKAQVFDEHSSLRVSSPRWRLVSLRSWRCDGSPFGGRDQPVRVSL